jgi:lysyl-tRNA synthetase class 2
MSELVPGRDRVRLVRLRHELCQALRRHLLFKGGVEVTTPVLHGYPDVAPIEQFTTRHPATGELGFLRIAPTEHLKRLIAAGMAHLPEFTSLEVMTRDVWCADMEHLAIECCHIAYEIAQSAADSTTHAALGASATGGRLPVTRLALAEELRRRFQLGRDDLFEVNALREIASCMGDSDAHAPDQTPASLMDRIATRLASDVSGLVLVTGFPRYLGGPAAPDPADPRFKQRTELFAGGLEIANMSSNLTDVPALRAWHEDGVRAKDQQGISTNLLDEPLLADLGNSFPISAVLGIGIERLLLAFFGVPDIRKLRQIA